MAIALRPLSTGELLDRTFSLYRSHFVLFLGITALPHLALVAFQLAGVALRSVTEGLTAVFSTLIWSLGASLLTLVVAAAAQAATIVAVSDVHLERPTSVMESYGKVKNRIPLILGLSIIMGLGIGFALVLLIVPGIILALRWAVAVPVAVLENKGVGDSLARSTQLTEGNRWRIFVIWVLFFILTISVVGLVQFPLTLVAAAMAKGAGSAGLAWVQVASIVGGFVAAVLVGPLATIAFSLVYYDERVRKEAFDLQLMMTTLDGTQAQVAPA
jgi:hypothetical protein